MSRLYMKMTVKKSEIEEGKQETEEENVEATNETDEEKGDEEHQEAPAVERVRKKRDQDVFKNVSFWHNDAGNCVFESGEELDKALWELAKLNFQGNKANNLFWISKQGWVKRKRSNDWRMVYYCKYHYQSHCNFRLEVLKDAQENFTIRVGKTTHTDHNVNTLKSDVPHQVIATAISSPSALKLSGPKTLTRKATSAGISLDEDVQRKAARKIEYLSKKYRAPCCTYPKQW
jgi:hypothetical protein